MSQNREMKVNFNKFWYIKEGRGGCQFVIKKVKLLELLKKNGYLRYKINDDAYQIFKVFENKVRVVNATDVADFLDDIIDGFPDDYEGFKFIPKNPNLDVNDNPVPKIMFKEDLREKFYSGINTHLSETMLYRLRSKQEVKFQEHTEHEAYFFYKNCFVKVTPKGLEEMPYSKLENHVFENQILDREFHYTNEYDHFINEHDDSIETKSDIMNFLAKVCGIATPDISEGMVKERILSLKSLIGYALHTYQGGKRQAILFTDSQQSDEDEPNGRSGKTLVTKMLGWVLNANSDTAKSGVFTEINGKAFSLKDKHRYEKCSLATKLICMNDVKRNFPIDEVFNAVTETFSINPKNDKPYEIYSKLIINTNLTLNVSGESAKDRIIQFEFANYYNSRRSPLSETGRWFGRDWDQEQWNYFDSFMMDCVKFYLSNGIIKPPKLTIHIRTVKEHTSPEFYDFALDAKSDNPFPNIKPNTDYKKKELLQKFLDQYPEFERKKWFSQRTFTKWCRTLCNEYYEGKFTEWSSNSNIDRYFKIHKETE